MSAGTKRFLPWRFGLFLLACTAALPLAARLPVAAAIMLGFDLAALLFIATLKPLFAHDAAAMRRHARENDANRTIVLVLTAVVSVVILVVIVSELRQKDAPSALMLALAGLTLTVAWLFSNLVYTVHYAYLFYSSDGGGDHGGLTFPDRPEPDYWDFAYFAFTLGMTFQTSDVEIGSPAIRKTALFHCLAAFVFNLGVIGFTINLLGGG